jgi:hypothetical protein
MTLPLRVTQVPSKSFQGALPVAPRQAQRDRSGSTHAWDGPRLRSLLEDQGGTLGPCGVEQRFDDEHLGLIRAGEMLALPALVIVAGETDAIIEQSDDGNVLTGRRGSSNDCRLIFRHAYGRVRCTLRTVNTTGDVHIGLLDHRRFDEVQAINILRPRGTRGDTRGSLWTTLEYRADPLCELQGIAWRGGLIQIASISLSP